MSPPFLSSTAKNPATNQYSAKDVNVTSELKTLHRRQTASDDLSIDDLKLKLLETEAKAKPPAAIAENAGIAATTDDKICAFSNPDADSDVSLSDEDAASASGSNLSAGEDDSDDETAALLLELEKIKKQKAAEKEKKQMAPLAHNPLLPASTETQVKGETSAAKSAASIKRRWNDDCIFKNQAASDAKRTPTQKTFVNDMLRSETHKKFLERYIS